MTNQYVGPRHTFLIVAAIFCLFFGLNEIAHRLLIEVHGKIISSETTTGYRPATTYVILGDNGNSSNYVAGPTDRSLERRMPIGTYIIKNKHELSWQKNGKTIADFPIYFYLGACCLGVMLAFWGLKQWQFNRPKKINA